MTPPTVNKKFVEFLPDLADRLGKKQEWVDKWTDYMTKDSLTFNDGSKEDIPIDKLGFVKKGMITDHLIKDICESLVCEKADEDPKGEKLAKNIKATFKRKAEFEDLGKIMMTADRDARAASNQKEGYTIEHLMQQLKLADNDPRLFKQRDV